jgi:hypothetical protein
MSFSLERGPGDRLGVRRWSPSEFRDAPRSVGNLWLELRLSLSFDDDVALCSVCGDGRATPCDVDAPGFHHSGIQPGSSNEPLVLSVMGLGWHVIFKTPVMSVARVGVTVLEGCDVSCHLSDNRSLSPSDKANGYAAL